MAEKLEEFPPAASRVSDEEIINPHSEGAEDYRFRAPYAQALFKRLAENLPLSSDMRLLDLCCGSGQLATGIADRVATVVAVDGAQGMIAAAPSHPKVRYFCHDINRLPLPTGIANTSYHHLLLGRAIPYVSARTLGFIIEHCLDSSSAIVVCGAGFNPQVPWVAAFNRLRGSYARVRGDFLGHAKLARLGFFETDRVLVKQPAICDPKFLIAYALSYSLTRQRIAGDMPRFRAMLRQAVAPHIRDSQLHAEVVSWALIYRREPDADLLDAKRRALPRLIPLPL